MPQTRFFAVAIAPGGPPVHLDQCAVTHASLVDPEAGSCTLHVGKQLLARLDARLPQTPICLPIGADAMAVRVEGPSNSPGIHLLGRTDVNHALPASNGNKRVVAATPPAATSPAAVGSAVSKGASGVQAAVAAESAPAAANGAMISPPPATNAGASNQPSSASGRQPTPPSALRKRPSKYASPTYKDQERTSRLKFNKEVLVAEYIPKRAGISPKSTHHHESLDEMVKRAEQRALEEMQMAMDDEDDDEDEDDDPYGGSEDAVAAFHELLRGLGGGGRGAAPLYQQRGRVPGGG